MTHFVYLIPLSCVNISAREMAASEGMEKSPFPTWIYGQNNSPASLLLIQ